MPPSPARSASTLASTGAPAARAVAARRATSPGLADGSRPRLLSPQVTRSGRAPAGRERLSRSLARNRSSTGPTTPGCTNATRADPAGAGGGRHAQNPAAARGRAAAAAAAITRVGPGVRARTAPRAATDSSTGAFHWLAPSSPQGPPRPSQDRTASPATNAAGTSTRAAASRTGVGPVDNPASAVRGWATLPVGAPGTGGSGSVAGGSGSVAPPSRERASQPAGSQHRPRSMASGTMNGPTTGTRKALTARKNPVPPSPARIPASGPEGAAMARSSTGTSPTRASHHHPGRGK